MTTINRLHTLVSELEKKETTADFEYEAIFEEHGGSYNLASSFTLLFQGKILFSVSQDDIHKVAPDSLLEWICETIARIPKNDMFMLDSLETEMKEILLQKIMKKERLERRKTGLYPSDAALKKVLKEIKVLDDKLSLKTRRISELKKSSCYVCALFLMREEMSERKESDLCQGRPRKEGA